MVDCAVGGQIRYADALIEESSLVLSFNYSNCNYSNFMKQVPGDCVGAQRRSQERVEGVTTILSIYAMLEINYRSRLAVILRQFYELAHRA